MRELDLLLVPFAREVFPGLEPQAQAIYTRLLEAEDPTLLRWMQIGHADPETRGSPEDAELAAMVDLIRQFSRRQGTWA